MSVPVAIEQAGPELLAAVQLALPALRHQRDTLLELSDPPCVDGGVDPELQDEFDELQAAIVAAELAQLKATTPPGQLSDADRALIEARFPAPAIPMTAAAHD